MSHKLIKKEMILGGLNCAHCAEVINEKVSKLYEIESCNLNFINKKLTLNIYDQFNEEDIINKVVKIIDDTEPGLNIQIVSSEINKTEGEKIEVNHDVDKKDLIKLIIGTIVYIFGIYQTATGFEIQ